MSDMTEIEAAKIAEQKGNADEKKFAAMMVTDHTKTSTELKSMVTRRDEGGASRGTGRRFGKEAGEAARR